MSEKEKITIPTWIIHGVFPTEEDVKKDPSAIYCSNYHTHGLDNYGHRELCIPFPLDRETASAILNNMGFLIANEGKVFDEGLIDGTDIITNRYNLWGMSYDNDPTLYVLVPDKNHKFPHHKNCDKIFKEQLLYAKYVSEHQDYV